jgi:hypothetical protein
LEKAILRANGEVKPAQPAQGHIREALADRITHNQSADQCRAAYRGAKHYAQVRAGVKAQAAADESRKSHRTQAP